MEKTRTRRGRRASEQLETATETSDDTSNLPDGKEFHYFLSHKKSHTKHGALPAQIAKNLHDSLELLGYTGWYDVDRLTKITQEELRLAITKCAAMVVVLNDETHRSEWCTYEWSVAAELGCPVKVVLDMERCSKETALKVIGAAYPHLMMYQWTELTERHRRDALTDVSDFLEDTLRDAAGEVEEPDGALRFGAHGGRLMHESFEYLLIFGGVPYRTPELASSRYWTYFVLYGRAVCLSLCLTRMVYATGPAFTDTQSALAIVLFHVYAFFAPFRLNRILRSDALLAMLASLEGGTTQELGERLNAQTRLVALVVGSLTAAAATLVYIGFLPLFFNEAYIGRDAAPWDQAFGWTSGIAFIFLIPPIVATYFAAFGLEFLLLSIGTMQLEASFDQLHPRVAELGLLRFLSIAHVAKLTLSSAALTKFHVAWNVGLEHYRTIQRELAPIQLFGLVTAIVGLTTPASLLLHGFAYDESVHPMNILRHLLAHTAVGVIALGLMLWAPVVYCTEHLKALREASLKLVTDNPLHRLFVTQLIDASSLTCHVAYALPATRLVAALAALAALASFVPWAFLSYYGATLLELLPTASTLLAGGADVDRLYRLAVVTALCVLLLAAYAVHLVRQIVDTERPVDAPQPLEV